jgi:aryl-alcohol dehydrogenase-like predicted oxidoreductase
MIFYHPEEGGPMEMRTFGKTKMQVAPLGFGGAEIGFEKASQDTAGKLLNEALDAGLNVVDTAECYMDSEELIGRAVAHRRKDYVLFTKTGHPSGWDTEKWDRASIKSTLERSLKRMKTDHVDLLQLHSCAKSYLEQGECIDALEELKKEGKTRFIGYSGDSDTALYAVQTGRFDALQISVSIVDQEGIERILPLAAEKQMGVIAKRPLGNVAWAHDKKPENAYHVEYWERFRHLDYDFLGGDRAAAIRKALLFTLSAPAVHTAIVGTSKPGRWTENAKMLEQGTRLNAEEFEQVRAHWRERSKKSWVGQM